MCSWSWYVFSRLLDTNYGKTTFSLLFCMWCNGRNLKKRMKMNSKNDFKIIESTFWEGQPCIQWFETGVKGIFSKTEIWEVQNLSVFNEARVSRVLYETGVWGFTSRESFLIQVAKNPKDASSFFWARDLPRQGYLYLT